MESNIDESEKGKDSAGWKFSQICKMPIFHLFLTKPWCGNVSLTSLAAYTGWKSGQFPDSSPAQFLSTLPRRVPTIRTPGLPTTHSIRAAPSCRLPYRLDCLWFLGTLAPELSSQAMDNGRHGAPNRSWQQGRFVMEQATLEYLAPTNWKENNSCQLCCCPLSIISSFKWHYKADNNHLNFSWQLPVIP